MKSSDENLLQMGVRMIEEKKIEEDDRENEEQKCFAIIPSLFRKRSNKYKIAHLSSSASEESSLSPSIAEQNQFQMFPITNSCLAPGSPISPRVKNFNSDMRELAASRTDNPYICQKLDRSNSLSSVHNNNNNEDISTILLTHSTTPEETSLLLEPSTSSLALLIPSSNSYVSQTVNTASVSHPPILQRPHEFFDEFHEIDEPNLHDKLVRSPPPHFPKRLSQFLCNENLMTEIENNDEMLTVTQRDS